MKLTLVLAQALAFSAFTSAWPWPPSIQNFKELAQENGLYQRRSPVDSITVIQARQDTSNNGGGGGGNGGSGNNPPPPPQSSGSAPPPSSGSAPPPPSSGSSAAPSSAGSSGDSSGSGSAPPPPSGSGSASGSGSGPGSNTTPPPSSQYTDSIPAGAQPGMVNMITPNTQSTATQYYKVNQTITWVWNYTSLSRPPQAIDILATMSGTASGANPSPFTIATNYSFAPTETFTWDTQSYVADANGMNQLPMGMYTLMVYDAAANGGVSATASPGYLGLFNQFHFGMYSSQPATALATPYQCATCNSARNQMERMTVTGVLAVAMLTTASFMWFANGFGGLA